ncbi:MAG: hypothetical protein WB502_12955 [Thermoactinomyces sp.]
MPISQVKRIEYNDEEIGMGFNSETGEAVGTALEGFTVTANPVAPGMEVQSSVTIVNSHEELMNRLGMSFEGKGRYGFISASAKAQFSESTSFNSTSSFLVASCVVQNPFLRGKNFRVKPEAKALLDALRFDEFKTAYGDSFVRGIQTGGEFYAVIRITSVSISKQTELTTTLQAELNGLLYDGAFKGQFEQANQHTSTRSEYHAMMFQRGGSGITISPTVEINEVINRFKNFPEIARANAFGYETEIASYSTLPLPVPTPEEQEDFLFALRDAREKKLYYIQNRNDLQFALRNPMFFKDLPSNDVLLDAISRYTKLINAVMDHAIKLSRGQMNPPKIFDPSDVSLTEPPAIPLHRVSAPEGPMIRVPNMIGIDNMSIEEALRCFSVGTVEACVAGTADFGRVGESRPIRVGREIAEFLSSVRIVEEPEVIGSSSPYKVKAQFPSAGTFVPAGSEIILQFEEFDP